IERMGKKPGPMLDNYASMIDKHSVWVIKENKQVIGSLVLMKKEGWMLLDNVAVHPEHQGRKLGKQLCQFAEAEAVKQGFTEIRLYTHEMMVENVVIYEKMGYIKFERRHELGYARIYMRKQLVSA
ncbi:MAG: GNAT family N-acetyltransferase, partial [Candidatus Promineifilaceae bacterium]